MSFASNKLLRGGGLQWKLGIINTNIFPIPNEIQSVAYGNGQYIFPYLQMNAIGTSNDGIIWNDLPTEQGGNASGYIAFVNVAEQNPTVNDYQFLICDRSGRVIKSNNGINWTLACESGAPVEGGLTTVNGSYGESVKQQIIGYSPIDTFYGFPNEISYFIYGTNSWITENGPNATQYSILRTVTGPPVSIQWPYDHRSVWIAVNPYAGNYPTLAAKNQSQYSIPWNQGEWVNAPSGKWNGMVYGNGVYVAVNQSAVTLGQTAMYLTDAGYNNLNWQYTSLPSISDWHSVAYGKNMFVAISKTQNKSAYSYNGINWIPITMPTSSSWNQVIYGDNKFIAVGDGGKIAYLAV